MNLDPIPRSNHSARYEETTMPQNPEREAGKAGEIGHNNGEKAEAAKDQVRETARLAAHHVEQTGHVPHVPLSESKGAVGSPADIREHMEVYASCGTFVGAVDRVEGDRIKLTREDSPDGQHHLIPMDWVARVHDHIHLNKDHKEVQDGWQAA
jgi:hypothetical protein